MNTRTPQHDHSTQTGNGHDSENVPATAMVVAATATMTSFAAVLSNSEELLLRPVGDGGLLLLELPPAVVGATPPPAPASTPTPDPTPLGLEVKGLLMVVREEGCTLTNALNTPPV